MSQQDETGRPVTPESRLLDRHPGLRETVEALPDFIVWIGGLPVVEIDGETFHVARGDQLMDRDQAMVEWIRLFRPELLEEESDHDS